MHKIISVVAARPNFIKLAPLASALRKYKNRFIHKIVHTGQHYDYELSQIFFKDLKLPKPDIYLKASPPLKGARGMISHVEQITRIMQGFEKVLQKEKPDLVIVYGDVNSTLACSVVCSKSPFEGGRSEQSVDPDSSGGIIPLAHVEAGLRSFDLSMPEEINRIVSDHLSRYLFVTEKFGVDNLRKEDIPEKNIFLVGDVMVDALIQYREKFRRSKVLDRLNLKSPLEGGSGMTYALVTLHRPVNVDNKKNLLKIISIFEKITSLTDGALKIIFPLHPRTRKMFHRFGLMPRLNKIKALELKSPFNYTDFIKLLGNCKFVLTDSGGIQSEATFLRIPCLTLRDSLEKPEAIETGTVTLCALNERFILKKVQEILKGKYKKGKIPRLMDGHASSRIAKILARTLHSV